MVDTMKICVCRANRLRTANRENGDFCLQKHPIKLLNNKYTQHLITQ